MPTYEYKIIMQTPLGPKKGAILLAIDANKINGFLSILGNKSAFQGERSENGACELHGQIVTLTRTIAYTASGHIDESTITLTLHGERNVMNLSGTAYPATEGD